MSKKKCILTLALLSTLGAMAQKTFTLEDLNFGGTRYQSMIPERRHYVWWGDELVRLDVDGVFLMNKKSGEERALFTLDELYDLDAKQQSPADTIQNEMTGVNLLNTTFAYKEKPLACILTPTKRLLYDFKKKEIVWRQQRTGSLEWNATSKVDAFLKDANLWLRLANGEERQLTTDGSQDIVYGQSVHRNEFGIVKGTFFSNDGKKVAFYRMDQSMVTAYPQVNTFTRIAEHEPDRYPMAGMTSHEVTIGIHDIELNKTVYLKVGSPINRYFTNISWGPDGKHLYIYEVNREQNKATLDEYSATDGNKIRTIDTEVDQRYVEPLHPIIFLPWDAEKFIAWSQKDGYWHLYLYDLATGKCTSQLTKGDWVVDEVIGFSEKTKSIIILANKTSHVQRNAYVVNVETGAITPLDNEKGSHSFSLSASGKYAVDCWSEPSVPRQYALTDIEKISKKGNVKAQKNLFTSKDPWKEYAVPHYKKGTLMAADKKTELHWRMVLPPNFSEEKQYPTVVYVYGGPHAHMIEASWHWASRSWETYMAQLGYIVFVLDNRGSERRGKDFEQVTFRNLGKEEMLDQMCGVDYLRSLPYVDASRLGVHGWSYGGYMTISLMTNYPDVFKVGVAGGPVIDWKWYEVMYGERYMDTPEENPEGYASTSLLAKAKNLKGRLQIITGMNDPIVVPQHSLQFINACNEVGVHPDFYVYPGEGHNMMGHLSVHLHERITDYFERNLK